MSRLHVKELNVSTKAGRTLVPSLDIDIEKGEWFSIIGESGSGKSVSAFAITDMLPEVCAGLPLKFLWMVGTC